MSEREFESYLRLLSRFLGLNQAQREAIGLELRGHMEDRLEELLGRGYTRDEAITAILDEFGDTAALASEFGKIGRRRKWIMRTTTGTIAAAVCILVVSFLMPEHRTIPAPAMTQAEEASSPAPVAQAGPKVCAKKKPTIVVVPKESEADRLGRERLGTIIPSVEFEEGAFFEDVVEFLREVGKTSISVSWNALEALGIDRTTPTGGINLRNVKLETALDILIANVGGPDADLAYDVYDGIVQISTAEELSARTITRVYNVRPLLDAPLSASEQTVVDDLFDKLKNTQYSPGAWAMSRARGQTLTGEAERSLWELFARLRACDAEMLVDCIVETVALGSWGDGDDKAPGRINLWKDRLIVTHTPRAHREVLALLHMLLEVDRPTTRPAE